MEGIYLLCFSRKTKVYRVGRTTQGILSVLKRSPKESRLVMWKTCPGAQKFETPMIRNLAKKFEKREDYGRKYFCGNEDEIVSEMLESLKSVYEKKSPIPTKEEKERFSKMYQSFKMVRKLTSESKALEELEGKTKILDPTKENPSKAVTLYQPPTPTAPPIQGLEKWLKQTDEELGIFLMGALTGGIIIPWILINL